MNYGKIKPVDVANGQGIRVSLFVSGCPHQCEGCFNPELWDYDAGQWFNADTINEILDLCAPDYISGLSLLGGEPLAPGNYSHVRKLCVAFKSRFPDKTIWCYTGYVWRKIKHRSILRFIDIIVDGKFVEERKDPRLRFRGSSNQRIIDVQKSLESGMVIVRKDLMGE